MSLMLHLCYKAGTILVLALYCDSLSPGSQQIGRNGLGVVCTTMVHCGPWGFSPCTCLVLLKLESYHIWGCQKCGKELESTLLVFGVKEKERRTVETARLCTLP